MDALPQSGEVPHALKIVDNTMVCAHHPVPGRVLRTQGPERGAAGAKGGSRDRVTGVHVVASRPRSVSSSMPQGYP